jgi:transposase-like protein
MASACRLPNHRRAATRRPGQPQRGNSTAVTSLAVSSTKTNVQHDVFVSTRRDATAARRFFERAIGTTKVRPAEVMTDQAPVYPMVLEEMLPAAWHRTDRYANNRVEADHGRLKARLRPMRGLKQDRSARVIIAGHAFVQNLRRGHYELGVEQPATRRVEMAFDELVLAI